MLLSASLLGAVKKARSRPHIKPRGSSSISRMVAILSDGTSTFTGENSYRTHPFVAQFSSHPSRVHIHAEASAILKAIQYFTKIAGCRRDDYDKVDLSGFKLSVARVLADGSVALAKPCIDCQKIINRFNIKDVEWTINK